MQIKSNSEYPQRLRLAVIGCGGHAQRNIFPTFQFAPVDLAAVCDLNLEQARAGARLWGAPAIYQDYGTMLAEIRPDAVIVVTNADDKGRPRYPKIAADVLRSGAHVWIEKPPAASIADVELMQHGSLASGKWVGVGFKKMFAPANAKAKQIVSGPEFGALSSITVRYPQFLPPIEDRSNDRAMRDFLDHIVHPYSVLVHLAGPVESIYVERNHRSGASMTSIRFKSGAVGNLHLTVGNSGWAPLERTEIVGEGHTVVVDNNLRLIHYRDGGPEGGYGRAANYFGASDNAPLIWEPEFSLGQLYNKGIFLLGYAPEILYFCDCVLANRAPEIGTLDQAMDIVKVYEAYRQPDGQRIEVG